MVELARTVRFCVDFRPDAGGPAPRHNTFGGWPSLTGLGAYYEIEVRCRGTPDEPTGYLDNISTIDHAVRSQALPIVERAVRTQPDRDPALVLTEIARAIDGQVGGTMTAVAWRLTPYYSLAMETDAEDRVLIRQQFEFAAAHRLHCPEMSDADNRTVFGKCNNENGHGHNYRVEVVVAAPLAADGARPFRLPDLEAIVDLNVIERFDHTHLNLDTPDFADLNPSVEHIAKVCHDLLLDPVAESGARLRSVTVWETDRTCCTYPG